MLVPLLTHKAPRAKQAASCTSENELRCCMADNTASSPPFSTMCRSLSAELNMLVVLTLFLSSVISDIWLTYFCSTGNMWNMCSNNRAQINIERARYI